MKRTHFSKILTSASAVIFSLGVSSCIDPGLYYPPGSQQALPSNANGAKFKQDLERAVATSDRIVVLEHSHASDFTGIVPTASKPPYYSYGSRVLSSSATADFQARVRNLTAYNSRPSNRQFQPHHTIKFYSAGRLKSSMLVSFGINEVRWNGSRHTASQDIIRAVGPVIANAGFRTSRDWNGLARIEYSNGRRTSGGSIGAVGGANYPSHPSISPSSPKPPVTPPAPVKPTVRTAKPVPGKPGHVFNPFTQNHVDVNGIPSGTKVRDPNDGNQAHIFRVP